MNKIEIFKTSVQRMAKTGAFNIIDVCGTDDTLCWLYYDVFSEKNQSILVQLEDDEVKICDEYTDIYMELVIDDDTDVNDFTEELYNTLTYILKESVELFLACREEYIYE
jgi:hypothetical protein